ncbi:transcription initiation factor IIE subunit alpha [Cynara cardunculus var. scolymus]|uniref:transcription initiation factor IIE subunit alpha n=1 Tax=Cynara cardunculus var. scolymus TaxID=59895 RepID=UPI000D62F564|nr:transcription initiation factor IIE subunit alpha [Cynara cardunculus var. scolymus]
MSIEPFNKLVKLTARAFYDDITAKGDNQPKTGRSDNRGIAVVVLDALTRRQWVREEDLAKDLKLHLKQLRRTLRFFEEEKLVTRDHRKETAKGAKAYSAAVAATADNLTGRDGEEKIKLHTHSYCCLDYAQIHDVVRYRLHRMKKKLKDELDNKNTVQEYVCPKCGKRYNALDAIRLISFEDDSFHCESCNTELVAESDKLASQDIGDGDDNARRRRREKLRDMLQKMEVELKPLMDQLSRVKDLDAPDYGTLQAWELRASAAARASNADPGANDSSRPGQGGTPMPFLGETKVEVAFSGVEEKGEIKSESAPMKVLPPWMIKEGMNLTNEQRGGVKQESNMEGTSASIDMKDEKKLSSQEDDAKNLQDEYFKAYYAALLQRQKEQEEATKREQDLSMNSVSTDVDPSNSRKRQRDDDGEGDVEWEETPTAGETFKVDLNVEAAEPSGDDEDDDGIDWEEG